MSASSPSTNPHRVDGRDTAGHPSPHTKRTAKPPMGIGVSVSGDGNANRGVSEMPRYIRARSSGTANTTPVT